MNNAAERDAETGTEKTYAHCKNWQEKVNSGKDRTQTGTSQRKKDQPEGLNARAGQVLSWLAVLEQNTACVWGGLPCKQIAKK